MAPDEIARARWLKLRRDIFASRGPLRLTGAPEGFDALVMGDIVRARGGLSVFVARDDGARASAFSDALTFFAPEVERLQFPGWDCLPYDRAGPSPGRDDPAHGDPHPTGASRSEDGSRLS